MTELDLKSLKNRAKNEIERAEDLKGLNELFNRYLGKRGEIPQILRSLKDLPKTERARIGKGANELKDILKLAFEKKEKKMRLLGAPVKETGWLDITIPGKKPSLGHLHPLTLIKRKAEEIFQSMGFEVIEGPEAETEWYNFDALNIPKEHPARDMWDTFWLRQNEVKSQKLKVKSNRLLLRTHTSPVQIRYMEKNNPPLRVMAPGKVFRYEATDASHETNFYQLEGLMVGKNISAANFKAIIQEFYRRFFGKPVEVRLRPSYFPFTEPSFEVDMSCVNCGGKGCSVCSKTGWLEMMGAGMVHPNVYKNSGLNPKGLTGFAFGMGLDRLAMMKYKINDIRLFHSGDLRFLEQF